MDNKKTIITIGRQFGSGGREIGVIIAEELGIKLYDKEMLKIASEESGLCEEFFEKHDEKPTSSFLYSLVMDTYAMNYSTNAFSDMPLNHKVFLAQYNAIKKIASEDSCILIGRCADYALDDIQECSRIFVHANMESRIHRIARIYDLTDTKAKDLILKTDKKRSAYYNYFSNKKWGYAESYDLSIDSSILGPRETANAIIEYVKIKNKTHNNNL
ncbi:MAG: cytidylate kinase-like family protein [Eubacteriales bacterium]